MGTLSKISGSFDLCYSYIILELVNQEDQSTRQKDKVGAFVNRVLYWSVNILGRCSLTEKLKIGIPSAAKLLGHSTA